MKSNTVKNTLLALVVASFVPLAACGDDNNNSSNSPTAPTATGPTVTTPAPTPTPPAPPAPTPTPEPPSDTPAVSVSGMVYNLDRSGANDLNIEFRLGDVTVVKAASGTPVVSGGQTFNTDAVRNGQTVTVEGMRTQGDYRGDFLIASKITITAQAQ